MDQALLMETPLYQKLHEGLLDDIDFDKKQYEELSSMQIKHIHDPMGAMFLDMMKAIDGHLKEKRREYKKIYGRWPR